MNILILVNHAPYPPTRGDKSRDYNVVKHVSENHKVDVCFIQKYDDPAFTVTRANLKKVHLWKRVPSRKWKERILRVSSLFFGFPSQVFSLKAIGVKKGISGLLNENQYDIIISEKFYAACLIPKSCKIPVLIDNHNIEYVYYDTLASESNSFFRKLFYRADAKYIFRAEKEILNRSAGSIFLSNKDYETACSLYAYKKPFCIIPQGIDRARLESLGAASDSLKRSDLLFVGNLSQSRNFEPLCAFIKNAKAHLSQNPDFRMVIIGKGAPQSLQALCDGKHFEYLGFQEDLDSWIHNTRLVYSFLPGGSGVKTKIIEGLAFNKKVICDYESAHAVPDLIPHGIIVVRSIEDAWQQTIAALAEGCTAPLPENNTREYIIEHYSWDNLIERYIAFAEDLVRNKNI